jgi:preprotein translocase subunit YajC
MLFDPLTIVMFAVLAVLIVVVIRNGRKRKAQMEELATQIVPGAEVMTNFGMFGTLLSIDEVSNVAEVETTPGTIVRVHRQTLAKVVTSVEGENTTGEPRSVEEAMAIATAEQEARDAEVKTEATRETAPEFGELAEEPVKKPARRPAKKTGE